MFGVASFFLGFLFQAVASPHAKVQHSVLLQLFDWLYQLLFLVLYREPLLTEYKTFRDTFFPILKKHGLWQAINVT